LVEASFNLTATQHNGNGNGEPTQNASGPLAGIPSRNHEWPLADAAVRQRFATATAEIVQQIVEAAAQAYLSIDEPKIPTPGDGDFAAAVDQAYRESHNQRSPKLFLTTVPKVIGAWAMYGRGAPEGVRQDSKQQQNINRFDRV
jgi:hypothetical protein